MAALFLLLALLIGVGVADAVIENNDSSSFQLFGQTISGTTLGLYLLGFALAGLAFGLLLSLSRVSSARRRNRRKALKDSKRSTEGRVSELDRENAMLRDELDRTRASSRPDTSGTATAVAPLDYGQTDVRGGRDAGGSRSAGQGSSAYPEDPFPGDRPVRRP